MKNVLCLVALSALANCASAGTGYYLVSTYPNEGERTVDFKYWNAKPSGRPPRSSPELGLGYNVNGRWFTEVSASWFQLSPGSNKLSALEWQNDFMLTQGQYPIDVALHSTIERDQDTHGLGLEIGPVFQTEIGRTQLNLNLFFERDYRVEEVTEVDFKYQWQVRQHWMRKLDVGLQGFGELGKWNDWLPRAQQSHRAGPALFGSWDTGAHEQLKYEAAYLIGKNSGHTAKSVTLRLQYAF
ncbi:MAG: hypothetical protein V4508_21100 [Pseudomonadota bacterium]